MIKPKNHNYGYTSSIFLNITKLFYIRIITIIRLISKLSVLLIIRKDLCNVRITGNRVMTNELLKSI